MNGATLISRLTPMKRLLCLCPVITATSQKKKGDLHWTCEIGISVSDPYLARASPIQPLSPLEVYIDGNSDDRSPQRSRPAKCSVKDDSFPQLATDFWDQLNLFDVEALALAQPLAGDEIESSISDPSSPKNDEDSVVPAVTEYLEQHMFTRYANDWDGWGGAERDLICHVPGKVSSKTALEMVIEDPDFLDELLDFLPTSSDETEMLLKKSRWDPALLHPSIHAAFALNQFLRDHTGGWQNTFG